MFIVMQASHKCHTDHVSLTSSIDEIYAFLLLWKLLVISISGCYFCWLKRWTLNISNQHFPNIQTKKCFSFCNLGIGLGVRKSFYYTYYKWSWEIAAVLWVSVVCQIAEIAIYNIRRSLLWELYGTWTIQTITAESIHLAGVPRQIAIPPTMYETSGGFINIHTLSE